MLEEYFSQVYIKFKLHFYKKIFSRFNSREASLSALETFSVEAIHALGSPTVNEFAQYTRISQQNAAYKVQRLIAKGYIVKVRSKRDKRSYHLQVTDKFKKYYGLNYEYITTVMNRIRRRFTIEEIAMFERMLRIISQELMPEVDEKVTVGQSVRRTFNSNK